MIVSGGQTGVDRAALDAALACGVPCGGWCPSDRSAEDGVIPDRYPLQPAPRPGSSERTLRNVLDSDGTLLIYHSTPSGGTEETLLRCLQMGRPYLLLDGGRMAPADAIPLAADFIASRRIAILNVAGPRASEWAGAYRFAFDVVSGLCQELSDTA
jgi:hypothetical protein